MWSGIDKLARPYKSISPARSLALPSLSLDIAYRKHWINSQQVDKSDQTWIYNKWVYTYLVTDHCIYHLDKYTVSLELSIHLRTTGRTFLLPIAMPKLLQQRRSPSLSLSVRSVRFHAERLMTGITNYRSMTLAVVVVQ